MKAHLLAISAPSNEAARYAASLLRRRVTTRSASAWSACRHLFDDLHVSKASFRRGRVAVWSRLNRRPRRDEARGARRFEVGLASAPACCIAHAAAARSVRSGRENPLFSATRPAFTGLYGDRRPTREPVIAAEAFRPTRTARIRRPVEAAPLLCAMESCGFRLPPEAGISPGRSRALRASRRPAHVSIQSRCTAASKQYAGDARHKHHDWAHPPLRRLGGRGGG